MRSVTLLLTMLCASASLPAAPAAAYVCPKNYQRSLFVDLVQGRQILPRGQRVTLRPYVTADCKHTRLLQPAELLQLTVTAAPDASGPFAPLPLHQAPPLLRWTPTHAGLYFVRMALPDLPPVQLVFLVTDGQEPDARPVRVRLRPAPSDVAAQQPLQVMMRYLPGRGLPPEQREQWRLPLFAVALPPGQAAVTVTLPRGLYEIGPGSEFYDRGADFNQPPPLRQTMTGVVGVLAIEQAGDEKLPVIR